MTTTLENNHQLTFAMLQMTSAATIEQNIEFITPYLQKAKDSGCQLVSMPECANLIQKDPIQAAPLISQEKDDLFIQHCIEQAQSLKLWIHIGSAVVKDPSSEKFSNRSLLINDQGEVVARYDKIHLFDVELGNGDVYRESDRYQPGTQAVIAQTPWGKIALTICYDLRFPHLFRDLAKAGADIFLIPAAFTPITGAAHWEPLMRARAIENGAFVIASAQGGKHQDGRETYGHSIAIDPWGSVICEAKELPDLLISTIDLGLVAETRIKIPSLKNERNYQPPC